MFVTMVQVRSNPKSSASNRTKLGPGTKDLTQFELSFSYHNNYRPGLIGTVKNLIQHYQNSLETKYTIISLI